MKRPLHTINLIVFYGALWGVLEATLGYALQFTPPFFSGMIMFPIASALLMALYLQTGSRRAMFAAGLLAAAIKSVNLLMPLMAWRTLTPMIAIVLESLMLASLVALIVNKPVRSQITGFVVASLSWRALFLGVMALRYAMSGFLFADLANMQTILSFVVYQGLAGAGIAFLAYRVVHWVMMDKGLRLRPFPAVSASLLGIAVVLTIFL